MEDDKFDGMENPFSIFTQSHQQNRKNLVGTLKTFFGVFALIGLITVLQIYRSRSDISRFVSGFGDQGLSEKLARLEQWQPSENGSLVPLVAALADPQPQVRELASERIKQSWSSWRTLPPSEITRRREICAVALSKVAPHLPESAEPNFQKTVETLAGDLAWTGLADSPRATQVLSSLLLSFNDSDPAPDSVRDASNLASQPVHLPDSDAAAWTDWPPTTTTPRLYRPRAVVASVAQNPGGASPSPERHTLEPVLGQHAEFESPNESNVRPSQAAAIDDAIHKNPYASALGHPSRRSRLWAVAELAEDGNAEAQVLLERRLLVEEDPIVSYRIRMALGTRFPGSRRSEDPGHETRQSLGDQVR
ncbi:MAG: hypothetical protein AAFV88_22380 [Planctomycetota bacterium]